MRNRYWVKASLALAGVAVLFSACHSSTSPAITKTQTVTATASVSATPTAPVSVQTSGSQSNVSASFDVAALQQIVALVGGGATITMADLASKDYGQLGSTVQSDLTGATGLIGVLSFSFQKSASGQVADLAFDRSAAPGADPTISYTIIGTDPCPSQNAVSLAFYGGSIFGWIQTAVTLQKSSGVISGSFNLPATLPNPFTLTFMCIGGHIGTISVTGGTG